MAFFARELWSSFRNQWVGRTPWSAAGPLAGFRALCKSSREERDEGVPRGPGGPPHQAHRMAAVRKLCGIVNLLLLAVFAAILRAEHLPIKIYTTADGLARNRVHAIMADSRGFVWISTADGLSVFDGYRFVNYGKRDGLPTQLVWNVLEARDGAYWVATNEGLCVLHPKGSPQLFTLYHRPGPEFEHGVNALVQDLDGTIWGATDVGLYRETGPKAATQSRPEWIALGGPHDVDRTQMNSIILDRQGALWIGAAAGLFRRHPDGRAEFYPTSYVEKVLQDSEGRIWAGTRAGLFRIVADPRPGQRAIERVYTEADGLGNKDIKSLSLAPDGTIWAGTLFGGVSQIRIDANGKTDIRTYRKAQGLSDDSITALEHDREGNLWLGGEGAGVMRIVHDGFVTYNQADGVGSERISQMLEDRNGNLCVAGNDQTARRAYISCFDGEKFQPFSYPEGYRWPWIPIMQDHSGEWWLGGRGLVGLGRIPLPQFPQARPEQALPAQGAENAGVYKMFEDSLGGIWASVGSQAGNQRVARVGRWQPGGGMQLLPPTNGPPEQLVSAFAEDHAGDIWMGLYSSGVVRYRNGAFTQLGARDGVPAGHISNIYVDGAGRVWIAGNEGGLGRVDSPAAEHPTVRLYDAAHGLSSDFVTSIAADRWGRIYVGTGRGVDRLDPDTGRLVHYTTNEGLANDAALTAFRDRRGWLWFGTTQGLSRLIPESSEPPCRCRRGFGSLV